jgi:hypothetical protein
LVGVEEALVVVGGVRHGTFRGPARGCGVPEGGCVGVAAGAAGWITMLVMFTTANCQHQGHRQTRFYRPLSRPVILRGA